VLGVELRVALQEFFGLLRDDLRERDLHVNELVAARLRVAQAGYAALAQAEALARLCAGRDAQLRLALDGRHLDARAERGLRDRDRHGHVDVVALAREVLVLADVRDDVEVARGRAHPPALALGRHPHARPRVHSRRNPDLHLLGLRHGALAVAERARRAAFARAAAVGALLREAQTPARALHLTRPVAGRAGDGVAARVARAVAARALLGAVDRDVGRQPRDRLLERERERHLDVRALLRHGPGRLLLLSAPAEEFGEDVAETGAAAPGRRGGGVHIPPIEACEVEGHAPARAAARRRAARGGVGQLVGVLAEAVVDLPLLRVGENLVRLRDELEA